MDKQTLLNEITAASNANLFTKDEVLSAYDAGRPAADHSLTRKLNFTDILYYIGGAIVVLGISILIQQNWTTLGAPAQILATLGAALAAFLVGVLFSRYPNLQGPSLAFFLISLLSLPIGLYVTFNKAGVDTSTAGAGVTIFALLLAMALASYFIFKKTIFSLFTILYGTALFFALVAWIMGNNPYIYSYHIVEYEFLISGFVYMLLGYYFSSGSQRALSGFLYGFGSLGFLGAALSLGGYNPNQNAFWELAYPLIIFAIIYLSIVIKSKSFLVFGSVFLVIYIFKLTAEYFSSGLGWPLALVLTGLIIIGISYYAVRLNKKFLSHTP